MKRGNISLTSGHLNGMEVIFMEAGQRVSVIAALMRMATARFDNRYSDNTIATYTGALRSFLRWVNCDDLSTLSNADVSSYVTQYLIPKRYSFSFQNQVINAVKLFFREVLKSEIETDRLQRPRREYRLANVLSREEVAALLRAHNNVKHRAMLSLIYACGLRRGELINLKPMDVDSKHHLLIIRSGKGRKDRVVPLSDKLLDLLREYYRAYRPEEWLFEGQLSGSRYSEQSLQCVLKQALKKARIRKPATLHWLRHSYATHLLEKGVTIDSSKKCSDIKAQKQLKFTRMSRKSVFKKYAHHSTISDQNVQIPMLVCKILSNIRHTKPRDSACIA